MKRIVAAAALAALLGLFQSESRADTLGPFTDSKALTTTDWTTNFTIPLFDTLGGTRVLDQVDVTLNGSQIGSIGLESLDAQPASLSAHLQTAITLTTPLNDLLAVVLPTNLESFSATAFDGIVDFAGTSGVTFSDLSNSQSDSQSYTLASILSQFTGIGNISLTATAIGTSGASGAGNLATFFASDAAADVSVLYTFHTVPEPGSLALLGLGTLGLAAARRRSRRTV